MKRRTLILDYKIEQAEHASYLNDKLQQYEPVKVVYRLEKDWGTNHNPQWLIDEITDMNGKERPHRGFLKNQNGRETYIWE